MSKNPDKAWSPLAVASCYFIALLLIAAGVICFRQNELSEEDSCTKTCSFQNKSGRLEYVNVVAQTAGMGSRGRQECGCH